MEKFWNMQAERNAMRAINVVVMVAYGYNVRCPMNVVIKSKIP